jgi:hypothetical protein
MSTSSLTYEKLTVDKTDNFKEVTLAGIMRVKVIKVDDPWAEGRVGCIVPRLMYKYSHDTLEEVSTEQGIDADKWAADSETQEGESVEDVNYIWLRPATFVFNGPKESSVGGSYRVPRIGTWIFAFFEDEDPLKGYYFPFGPTNDGEVISNVKSESPHIGVPETNPNVDIIREYPNQTIIYTDFNEDRNEVVIKFKNDHVLRIADRADKNGLELVSSHGNYVIIDDLHDNISVFEVNDVQVEAGHDITGKAGNNIQMEANNDATVAAKGNMVLQSGGNMSGLCGGNASITADGNATVGAGGNIQLEASGAVTIKAGTKILLQAGASIELTAPKIKAN